MDSGEHKISGNSAGRDDAPDKPLLGARRGPRYLREAQARRGGRSGVGPEGREGGGSRYRGFGGEEQRVLVDAGHLRRALHDHADPRQRQRHQPVLPAAQPRRHLSPPAGAPALHPQPGERWGSRRRKARWEL